MDVKLLLVLLILQSATANYSRWYNLNVGRYIRSVDKNEPAVAGRTSDEVNGQQIDAQNAAIEADSSIIDKAEVMIRDNTKESDRSSDSDQSSSSDESQGVGNGPKPCYGKNCPGNGNKPCYGKNCPGNGNKPCYGKNCDQSDSDDGSDSDEGSPCKGKGCNGGGGGIHWTFRKCSIFPAMTTCEKRDLNRIFDNISMDLLADDQVNTPIDYGFEIIDTFIGNYATPEFQMLRSVMPMTRAGFRGFFKIFRGFRKIVGRIIEFLERVGLIPPSLVNLIESLFPRLVSGLGNRNPLLSRTGLNSVQQKDASCPTTEYINFFKITALRTFLKKGLRVWLWLGVPRADVDKIRNILIKFLKDEYGHEFNCPLNDTPFKGLIADGLRRIFRAKVARLLALVTKKVLRWTQLDSTKFDTILDIINKFLEKLKDKNIKWDKLNYFLEVNFDKFKAFINGIIEKIFNAKVEIPAGTWIGKLGDLISSLINKLSPINFGDILATLTCQIFGKTPTLLNILEALSTIKFLQKIQPIGGIKQPLSLVNLIDENIPQQLSKFAASFRYLLDKIKSKYSTLICGVVKDVALSISNDITALENLLSGKPLSCLVKLRPKINALNVYANVRLARCVQKALVANAKIEETLRKKVSDFRKDIVNYYAALKGMTMDTILSHIQNGDALANRLDAYVRNAADLDLSALNLDACVQKVKTKVAARVEEIKEDISKCE